MAKRKGKKKPRRTSGEVYLLQIWVGAIVYTKIGYTSRTARCRLVEIGTELLDQLGYWPKMKIVKNETVVNPTAVESELLATTKQHRPKDLGFSFSGESELRIMPLDELRILYADCIAKDYQIPDRFVVEM